MLEVLMNTDLSSLFLNIYRQRYQNVFTLHHNAKGMRRIQTALLTTGKQSAFRVKKSVIKNASLRIQWINA